MTQPPKAGPPQRPAGSGGSLGRELWAILALYGFLSILPILVGWGCSGL